MRDPVCGMDVDPRNALSLDYKGKTYYFCSNQCKSAFERNPEAYIGRKEHEHHKGHEHHAEDFKRRFIVSSLLTPVLLVTTLFNLQILTFIVSTFIFFYGGLPFLKGMRREISSKQPGMMTLVGMATGVAYFYSLLSLLIGGSTFFLEFAVLIDIMLFGHYIEMRAVKGASKALEELANLLPSHAHLITSEDIIDVPVRELKVGDIVLVKPGERVPSDGVVVEGRSALNVSALTGESVPIEVKEGDEVLGGSINEEFAIKVRIARVGLETYLSQVIRLVEQAMESKSRTQNLADRFASWLTLTAITVGIITFTTWVYLKGDLLFSLERMVAVMVTTCPHALGLAIPLVVAVSTTISAKRGLIIRNRNAFEEARRIRTCVFDKTGTLTTGKFSVTNVIPFNGSERNIIKLAASAGLGSNHPIAVAIVEHARKMGVELIPAQKVHVLPGVGVKAIVDGERIVVAKPDEKSPDEINSLLDQGKTVVTISKNGKLMGAVALADSIRSESKQAIELLRKMGVDIVMITGDSERVAKWVAKELGIKYIAGVMPHEKAEIIRKLKKNVDGTVAMVGDGINDAPALVQADVGIAIGAGTDVAVESADVVLVRNDPRDVISVIKLSRIAYKKMVQNLLWAAGYNAIAIPIAAGVLL
ncbi:MAG: copper-translocating P-type ATPase [Candidatus Methanodesulfokora sp.]